jgi:hypothetical protein
MASRSQFFVVQNDRGSAHDTEFMRVTPVRRGEAPKCPFCGEPVGPKEWLPPRYAEVVVHGEQPGDFAFFGRSEFLLSSRAIAAFEHEQITGFCDKEKVEVSRVSPRAMVVPEYYFIRIARSRGAVDEEASCIARSGPVSCEECRLDGIDGINGFLLEEGSWSGEDFFIARGMPGLVLASDRVRQVVDRYDLTNAVFIETERYVRDPLHLAGTS